ncbi:MAG: hypothetical protein GW772_11385 [Flavobacteriia bacterium]|nr:hypothetical protein [Flavobacteriia bacterium]OIP47878.1 MAG: hypothetical protein AUK46_03570 [Flavobacteriaceae bacterium CG2_30_31_66]PIV97242.1 MAG: hypothetical protein COW43_04255 [Flavobacteriaceae bacterium CG17_big_fil_post_rev_8_21_14_2_50_31_13]PIX11027.1 MAG: hypothetical protein COZ74_15075 [Flavobacteriaceae bacterium CG_4_8_14_3_um_filter_31_8]PIY15427.1 MAG: hypothetical protein COZ16_04095 [Flavobacteriaceae bacterium CG_4_10_14_3_um_filter_31_253]PIZ12311.1 MAG: hypotheti
MKYFFKYAVFFLCLSFLTATASSCVVTKQNNGKKRGWFKNKKNPHNPNTTNKKGNKVKNIRL